jgi:hypothetical protein
VALSDFYIRVHLRSFGITAPSTISDQPNRIMNRCSIPLIAVGILAGCTTAPPPPLAADNPASPSAPEAIEYPVRNALAADDLTKKTRQIFARAAKQQEQPSPTPGLQQQRMDQMPGMKMP